MANFIPEQEKYKKLTPFKLAVLQNFPYIEEDFDALTNYGLMCKIVEYLNNVISNENAVESNVTELYNSFVSLHNYVSNFFDNLDVQDEINNKLDEMTESGVLQTLLLNYVTVTKVYNTHDAMISDTSLVTNSKCKTLGYYSVNDGGGAEYIISDVQPDSYYDTLNNNLYAKLIIDGDINVKSIGCKSDSNITTILSDLESKMDNNYTLYFPKGEYLISTPFETTKCLGIKGDGYSSQINCNSNYNTFVFNSQRINIESIFIYNTLDNISAGSGILLNNGYQCKIDKVKVAGFNENIIIKRHNYTNVTNCNIEEWNSKGILFENSPAPDSGDSSVYGCSFYPSNRTRSNSTAVHISSGGGLRIENNKINWYTIGYQPTFGIVLQPPANVTTFDLLVNNNSIENCSGAGIYVDISASNSSYGQIIINGNEIAGYNKVGKAIRLGGNRSTGNQFTLKDVIITNNIISQVATGIEYSYVNRLNINNNSYRNCSTCINKSGSANDVSIDEKSFSIVANDLLFYGLYGSQDLETPSGIIDIKDQVLCTSKTGDAYKIEMGGYTVVKGKAILQGMAEGVGAVYQETDFLITYTNSNTNVTLTPITNLSSGGYCPYSITETRDQSTHSVVLGYTTENSNVTSFNGTFEIHINGYKPRKISRVI